MLNIVARARTLHTHVHVTHHVRKGKRRAERKQNGQDWGTREREGRNEQKKQEINCSIYIYRMLLYDIYMPNFSILLKLDFELSSSVILILYITNEMFLCMT